MRRRSKAGGEPAKAQRRKTVSAQEPHYAKGCAPSQFIRWPARKQRSRGSPASGTRRWQQQTAPRPRSSRSSVARPFDLQTVLNTLLESAARLCEADKGVILRPAGDASYYVAATFRHTPEFIESQNGQLFAPGRSSVVGRVLLESKSVQIPDVLADPEYALRETARLGGFRTILGVPLLREGIPIGVLRPASRCRTAVHREADRAGRDLR